jgi:hypothetical protein
MQNANKGKKKITLGRKLPEEKQAAKKRILKVVLNIVLVAIGAAMIVLALYSFNLWLATLWYVPIRAPISEGLSDFTIEEFSLMEGVILILFGLAILFGETRLTNYYGRIPHRFSSQVAVRTLTGYRARIFGFTPITAGIIMFLIYFSSL